MLVVGVAGSFVVRGVSRTLVEVVSDMRTGAEHVASAASQVASFTPQVDENTFSLKDDFEAF